MTTWLIVEDGTITNVIVAKESFAKSIGAYEYYSGATVGGKYDPPTLEKLQEQITHLEQSVGPNNYQLQSAMMAFCAISTEIPDSYALDMPGLFPSWESVLDSGDKLRKGVIINDGGQLYRVNVDNLTPQEHQPPHGEGMTAVYVPINKTNAGTLDDPIPAVKGMEYTYGLYYLDPEDQKIYLCKRTGEADGGTIVLQYLPHDLIGHYFEVAA